MAWLCAHVFAAAQSAGKLLHLLHWYQNSKVKKENGNLASPAQMDMPMLSEEETRELQTVLLEYNIMCLQLEKEPKHRTKEAGVQSVGRMFVNTIDTSTQIDSTDIPVPFISMVFIPAA